ncbi:MAG: uroporphyrinogen-III synthase, partial [Sphingomonas sp.]
IRHGGAGLGSVRSLPTFAVGHATATAARGAGFVIAVTGDGDAATILTVARERGFRRLLHLAGRDRSIAATDIVATTRAVYASEPLDIAPDVLAGLAGSVAVLHSARAARRLGELLDAAAIDRASVRLAAIAPAVRDAAGDGWGGTAIACRPDDDALVVAARTLVD